MLRKLTIATLPLFAVACTDAAGTITSTVYGEEFIEDDVRLGGAVEDTGSHAGERGARIGDLVEENREDVNRVRERTDRLY